MVGGQSFLARLDDRPVGVGGFVSPYDRLTEVGGIGTRESDRRRGIGSALTSRAVRAAFERGMDVAMLGAGDEGASRVFGRIGSRGVATALA